MKNKSNKRKHIIHGFKKKEVCLTPESFFDIHITPSNVGVNVRLPMKLKLSEKEAIKLEDEIHDAMESILAKYF